MDRVTGLGGLFFRCSESEKMKDWYRTHLRIESDKHGGKLTRRDPNDPDKTCFTAWSPFLNSTEYFNPSGKQFMFNYRVENLAALPDKLRKEGVTVVGEVEEYDYGKFDWIMDPEGNKIELWEPIDEPLRK